MSETIGLEGAGFYEAGSHLLLVAKGLFSRLTGLALGDGKCATSFVLQIAQTLSDPMDLRRRIRCLIEL